MTRGRRRQQLGSKRNFKSPREVPRANTGAVLQGPATQGRVVGAVMRFLDGMQGVTVALAGPEPAVFGSGADCCRA